MRSASLYKFVLFVALVVVLLAGLESTFNLTIRERNSSEFSQTQSVPSIETSDLEKQLENVSITTRNSSTNTTGRCNKGKITGRRILINYASNCCYVSQPKNCQTGLETGGFDVCISFSDKSLDGEFKRRNARILDEARGAGLWLWKSYVILKTLLAMREDDVLFYCDAASHFVKSMDSAHVCLMDQLESDIFLFTDSHKERSLTKADAFILTGANISDPSIADTDQIFGGFVMLRRTFRTVQFVSQWLTYSQDYRIIGDEPSVYDQDGDEFIAHREDQSILSLLAKKWQIEPLLPDPSQWGEVGEHSIRLREQERFKLVSSTFIDLTRNRD